MLLKQISELPGASGYEKPIRDFLKKQLKKYCTSIQTDSVGNLICFKKGKRSGPRLMLAAHMDEVGFIVERIEKNGFIKLKALGGIDTRVVITKKIIFPDKKVEGIIGTPPIHLQKKEEMARVPDWDNIYADIGAHDEKMASRYLGVGDWGVFNTRFEEIGDVVKGKSFDDRVGCYILLEILKRKYDTDIYGVFTVQEEAGLRGIRPAVNYVKPDLGLVLECTTAGDLPNEKDVSPSTEMGKGPAITIMDRTSIAFPSLLRFVTEIAVKNKIPFQFKRTQTGGTDTGYLHLYGVGVPSLTIAVPARYIHSPVSFSSKQDIENAIKLTDAVVSKISDYKI